MGQLGIFSASKPPAAPAQPFKNKITSAQVASGYPLQRQSSRVRPPTFLWNTFA